MDPFLCPRSETVHELARILSEEQVVHVRGTTASGKTTLAKLLHEHNKQNSIRSVFIPGWFSAWDNMQVNTHIKTLVLYAQDAGYTSVTPDTIMDADITFIIDEAQMSYADYELWLDFIKFQSGRRHGPRICLFMSYGNPIAGPDIYPMGSPFAYVGVQQRISITTSRIRDSPQISLFYTRDEYDDVLKRMCAADRRPLPLKQDAADYIFSLTNGHPGAVSSVLRMIEKVYRSQIKNGNITEVDKNHIITTLDDEEGALHFLAQTVVQQSFVDLQELNHQAADVLLEVLKNGSIQRDLGNDGVRFCYENGWLHSEPLEAEAINVVCVFPTRLHAKFVEHYLTASSVPFPIGKYPTIKDLAAATLRNFSLKKLSSTTRLGTGAIIRPFEACYRDEFYRSLHEVLGSSSKVSSEWSGDGDSRIDFILGDVAWGFQVFLEGERQHTHCSPFVNHAQWVKNGRLRDWLIIDCRTSRPRPYNVQGIKLWRAVFSSGFSSLEVLDASNNVLIPRFPLMP